MIASLTRIINSGDAIRKIEGTFSGTLGYVMTKLQEGLPYSEIVNEAARLGYTEPDPRDDLGGVDVARKALIMARTLGWELEMKDVKIEPLYPQTFAGLPVPEFLKKIAELDQQFAAKSTSADKEGKVLRYCATVENGVLEVKYFSEYDKQPHISLHANAY